MIEDLLAGNERFRTDASDHCADRVARRLAQVHEQHPTVAVLSCADARVDPDVVFDAGLGDVFSVRIAGSVATTEAVASLRYATDVLGVPTVVVLGHDGCGAVGAVASGETPTWLASVAEPIRSAIGVGAFGDDGDGDDGVDDVAGAAPPMSAVRVNTCAQARRVRDALPADVQVLAAVYDPVSGRVAVVDTVDLVGADGADPGPASAPIDVAAR